MLVRRSVMLSLVILLLTSAALADPPVGYYDSVDASSREALRQTVHDVIDNHVKIPYTSSSTDTWDVLEQADEDPLDSSRILDLYRNRDLPKYGGGNNYYNREHTWPKSYGFPDDTWDNKPYTDCHHLFLCDIGYNGARDSRIFDDCTSGCSSYVTDEHDGLSGTNYTRNQSPVGIWQTWLYRRGDVARAIFYLDVRYAGDTGSEPDLIVTDDVALILSSQTGDNEDVGYMGLLTTLLEWHEADPVSDMERHRNDVIYGYQHNRNPFIDHPEWIDLLYGDGHTAAPEAAPLVAQITGVHPNPFNPATQVVFTLAEPGPVRVRIYRLDGKCVRSLVDAPHAAGEHRVGWDGRGDRGQTLASGPYLLRLESAGGVDSAKLLLLK